MKPSYTLSLSHVFLVIFVMYIAGFLSHAMYLKKTVYGDGVYYYAWLQSLTIDHDTDFTNDYKALGVHQQRTPTGMLRNVYSIGPALFWFPPYVIAHTILRGVGNEFPYQLIIGAVDMLYTMVGLLLLSKLLSRTYATQISLFVTAAIAFATNLYFYGAIDPVNSHAVSFFTSVVFLCLLAQEKKQWTTIGICLGLLGLIRPQDLLFGILLIPFLNWRMIIPVTIGLLLTFLPQVYLWHLFYGSWLVSPYVAEGLGFTLGHPHLLEVLFSPNNGLFFWTPILAIATIGLCRLTVKDKQKISWLLLIIAQWYLIASWSIWSQGGSYSGRMFISILPLFAFGLAEVFDWMGKKLVLPEYLYLVMVGPLSAINILFIIEYLFTH